MQYDDLSDRKTYWNECWNSWIDNLVRQVRHMDDESLELFTWHVAFIWNTLVINSGSVDSVHKFGPRHCALKRNRP